MKKLLVLLVAMVLLATMASATVMDDFLDIGNAADEAVHNAAGWGAVSGGFYGDYDRSDSIDDEGAGVQKDIRVVWDVGCADQTNTASFDLNAGANTAVGIVFRSLDGISGADSYEVYANGNYVGTYPEDGYVVSEIWNTVGFQLPMPMTGIIHVEIVAIDPAWGSCSSWGQVAMSWSYLVYKQGDIPEFTTIGAALALLGAAGFVAIKKRKQ